MKPQQDRKFRFKFTLGIGIVLLVFGAVRLSAQVVPIVTPTNLPKLATLLIKGNQQAEQSRWKEAENAFRAALSEARRLRHADAQSAALNGIGVVFDAQGLLPQAVKAYQEALKLNGLAPARLAKIRANLGNTYADMGRLQKAMEEYQHALTFFQKSQNTAAEAHLLNQIGNLYARMEQPQNALDRYQEALPLYKAANDPSGEAKVLTNISGAYLEMGQKHKIFPFAMRALSLYRALKNKSGEATILENIGVLYSQWGRLPSALENFTLALKLRRETHDLQGQAHTLGNLGVLMTEERKFPEAFERFKEAVAIYHTLGDLTGEATTQKNLAATLAHLERRQEALEVYRTTVDLWERVRRQMGVRMTHRQAFLLARSDTYRRYISLAVTENQVEEAFAGIQKLKARTLLDSLSGGRERLAGIPDAAQQTRATLQQQYDQLSLRLVGLESQANTTQAAEVKTQMERLAQHIERENDRLFVRYPQAARKQTAQTIGIEEVASFLPTDTALLEFAVMYSDLKQDNPDTIIVFVATMENGQPTLTMHSLPITANDLATQAEALRQACADPNAATETLSGALGQSLFPEAVRARLAGKKRLVVCPDGVVWNVPFAAVTWTNQNPLLAAFEIDYAYSAGGLKAALTAHRQKRGRLLAVANPEFGDVSRFSNVLPQQIADGIERPLSDPARPLWDPARPLWDPARLGGMMEAGKIKPLPGTQIEADALRVLYPDANLITGTNAQESEIVKLMPRSRYLHFATHGLFSDAAPLQSAIVLAQPPPNSPDDGFLTAREIYEMNLNAEMAVLSACETARGVNTDGEGVVGLTWALFAAGVPTQVVSQWKVSDASTPLLMEKFYSGLKRGEKKGQALRNAALKMMRDGKHAHPYHWAAFVLFGDWR